MSGESAQLVILVLEVMSSNTSRTRNSKIAEVLRVMGKLLCSQLLESFKQLL